MPEDGRRRAEGRGQRWKGRCGGEKRVYGEEETYDLPLTPREKQELLLEVSRIWIPMSI